MTQSASCVRKISLPVLLLLFGCADFTTQSLTSAEDPAIKEVVEPRVEAFLQKMIDEEHFSCVALVAKGGEVVHAIGYGVAAGRASNNVNTAFHVASVTKQFTAAAVMQLVEAGDLILDESINTYLPERYVTPNSGDSQNILSKASIDAMTTSQISMGRGGSIDGYGYGIGVGQRLIGHSGYIVGFRGRFDYDRQTGTLIAVFANHTANDTENISSGLPTIMLTPQS